VRDAAGEPVAATVVLRAVDEKLYSIAGAEEVDALGALYRAVPDGIRLRYTSHRSPLGDQGGGDTTGGGGDDRSDFRDSLLFTTIETGRDGRGSVSLKLSDDLTSWRISATAITGDLQAGDGTLQIPVGLPFFVDATIAPEYLVADRPTILIRTFGTSLDAGDDVSVTVEVPSLGLTSEALAGTAFGSIPLTLPALAVGRHEITIRATTGSGAGALSDGVTRTFRVVESRLTGHVSAYAVLDAPGSVQGGTGLTTVVISDATGGRHLPLLLDLAAGGSSRLDSSLAAAMAASLLGERYGLSPDAIPPVEFAADRYQTGVGGLALLPYAASSLELSSLAAIADANRFDVRRLGQYLAGIAESADETRERRIVALAGLAAIGRPVLPELRTAAADPELTIRERIHVAIGAARIGDLATARSIAGDLIAEHGEQLGDRIRLAVGPAAADVTNATALMAVLTASIGDPRAPSFWAYVEANPSRETTHDLHGAAYAAATLAWLDVEPVSFAWTLGAERTVVDLEPGQAHALVLTPAQVAELRIEPVDGSIGVATSWREPMEAGDFETDPDLTIVRTVTPSGRIGSDQLVQVNLQVTFGPRAPDDCHQVTDLVPSGLVAVGDVAAWLDPDNEEPQTDIVAPYFQGNQIVRFCAGPGSTSRVIDLRYYARVITPGSYAWEPAVIDSRSVPGGADLTPAATIEIR
jgi:hypothetical protein